MLIYQHSNVRVIAHLWIISVLEGQDSVIYEECQWNGEKIVL